MPEVEAIATGSVVYTSGSPTDPANITVGADTTYPIERSVLITSNSSNTNLGRCQSNTWIGELVESGGNLQIDFSRRSLTGAQNMTLEWAVITYASAALAQDVIHGTTDLDNDPETVAIDGVSTVDETLAMIICSGKTNTSNHFDKDACFTVDFINGTAGARQDLTFDKTSSPTSGANTVNYQVVEFTGGIYAEHGVTTTTGASESQYEYETQSISGFTTLADMFVLKTGQIGGKTSYSAWCYALKVNSTSQIEMEQGSYGTGVTADISWSVIEITDGGKVETGQHSYAITADDQNVNFSETLTDGQTCVVHGNSSYYNTFNDSGVNSTRPGGMFVAQFVNTDEASVNLYRKYSYETAECSWAVVDWTIPGAGPTIPPLAYHYNHHLV